MTLLQPAKAQFGDETSACTVWWADATHRPGVWSLLDPLERQRAERFRHSASRAHYTTARALLRLVLSERLARDPIDVKITLSCAQCGSQNHGKPGLSGDGPEFGLTHAGNLVGVAVHDHAPVGIDVEPASGGTNLSEATALVLNPAERAIHDGLAPQDRPFALLRWWTRKESALKAVGVGLTVPPPSLHVTPSDEPPALLSWPQAHPFSPRFQEAQLTDLRPPKAHVGCVTVLGSTPQVVELDGNRVLDRAVPRESDNGSTA